LKPNLLDIKRIYQEGHLPLESLRFQQIHLEYLRVSYWHLEVWHHQHLASPYWRFYWNQQEGGEIIFDKKIYSLLPNLITIIFPNTYFGTEIVGQPRGQHENVVIGSPIQHLSELESKGLSHFFVHFLVHQPRLIARNGIIQIPIDTVEAKMMLEITSACSEINNKYSCSRSFLLQSLILKGLSSCPKGTWNEQLFESRIQKVIDWMDEHLQQKIQNAALAQLVDMSSNGFARYFKEKTGLSPQDHLMQRRLQRAGVLLHHSRDSIENIAAKCGFCDRNYFSTHFKKMYGSGPSAYRKAGMN
jgi:AraC-like DNA-binding protein